MNRILIKLGGSSLQNANTLKQLILLIQGLHAQNKQVVVVHGGGPAINLELTARGITWQFINGQRQTTPEMMSVIEDVLAVKVNSSLVDILTAAGIVAYGHSGAHQQTLVCTQANAELMQVGKIETVNIEAVETILNLGAVPVIAPIGIGEKGEKYNINADWAATKLAMALQVEKLIFLTDQNGILNEKSELVTVATPSLINEMIESGVITGGMYTKVLTMVEALKSGVGSVQVLNAVNASDLLSKTSVGTLLIDEVVSTATKEVKQWTTTI
ncbi:MAG: acetylglutamate kinase [Pseudobdellovibrio sp.]